LKENAEDEVKKVNRLLLDAIAKMRGIVAAGGWRDRSGEPSCLKDPGVAGWLAAMDKYKRDTRDDYPNSEDKGSFVGGR